MTDEMKKLIAYLKQENDKEREWLKSNPNGTIFVSPENPEFWEKLGIFSLEQFLEDQKKAEEYEKWSDWMNENTWEILKQKTAKSQPKKLGFFIS